MIVTQPLRGLPRWAPGRALALGVAAALSLLAFPLASARADTPSTLTVVGTSDVQDSGLMPQLIIPEFEKTFPHVTLKYVSVGTGVAINDAETGQASALLVHAAALENQFVANGFSTERFGRAIFYGDYVLLGPQSDPAGVLTNAPHDIAGAFARIAAAGAAGHADFVSRGGTPGTTVQEHAIWALDNGTAGLNLCTVSAANGGGMAPSTATGNCPTTTANPPWYHTSGQTQAPNIELGNTCNFANATNSGGNDCYVFTDRGTFDCLMSAACAGGSAAPTNLKVVTRDNSATAPGGNTELINSFHAYAINPAKFAGNSNVQLNTTAAKDFLTFITSASFQAQLKTFNAQTDTPPFIADAAPSITLTNTLPSKVTGGRKITVAGTLRNLVPGTPVLKNAPVTITEGATALAAGVPVASGRTDSTGAFSISFTPTSTGSYEVSTGQILKVENSSLSPIFGDILQPAATTPSTITVHGAIAGLSVTGVPGGVLAAGSILPGADHKKGSVALLARRGKHGAFKQIASAALGVSDTKFALSAPRRAGVWSFEIRFTDPGQVVSTTSKATKLTISAPGAATVSARSLSVKNGKLTIAGKVTPGSATTVQVLGLDVGPIAGATPAADAAAGKVSLHVIGKVTLRAGASTFTVHATLRRGQRWIVALRAGTALGALKTARVT